jgi:serine/threonine protein kinase
MVNPIRQISPEKWALYNQGKLSEIECREIDQFLKENGVPEELSQMDQSHNQDSLINDIRLTSTTIQQDMASRLNPSESDVLTLTEAWPDIFSELGNPIISIKQTIGNYRLIENVSLSKMGRVYLAEDLTNGSRVAIKFPAASLDANAVERFRREIRIAKQLKHSQIVTVIDELQFREMPVYVMPWVEGVDLGRLVQFKGALPIEDVIEIGRQSALILEYLNKHRVVHRDIKPSNLILTPTGEIKLIDLGLAILQQFDVTDESLTESVQILGTLDYMAPEQAREAHSTDIRSDIYSLGCTLYKLATGKAPFENSNSRHVLQKVMAHALDDFQDAHVMNSSIPIEFSTMIQKMCAKKPSDRYSSPLEIAKLSEGFGLTPDLKKLIADANELQTQSRSDSTLNGNHANHLISEGWSRSKFLFAGACVIAVILLISSYNMFSNVSGGSQNRGIRAQENAGLDSILESEFPMILSPKFSKVSGKAGTRRSYESSEAIDLIGKDSLFIADVIDNGVVCRNPLQSSDHTFYGGIITPQYAVFDSHGDLFVSSFWTNSISRITQDGSITVFASSGLNGPRGLAFDPSGNMFVANSNNNTISKITPDGKTSEFLSNGLAYPYGLAFDTSGWLYVANSKTDSILRISSDKKVETFAVLPAEAGPQGLRFDASGTLFSANHNGTIFQIDREGGTNLFASGFGNAVDIAFDSLGNMYCSDYETKSISRINQNGDILMMQNGIKQPFGLAIKSGRKSSLP